MCNAYDHINNKDEGLLFTVNNHCAKGGFQTLQCAGGILWQIGIPREREYAQTGVTLVLHLVQTNGILPPFKAIQDDSKVNYLKQETFRTREFNNYYYFERGSPALLSSFFRVFFLCSCVLVLCSWVHVLVWCSCVHVLCVSMCHVLCVRVDGSVCVCWCIEVLKCEARSRDRMRFRVRLCV